jgi:hypothetical protein
VLSVTGAVQLAMPERLSVPVNVTVTLVLFQPAAFGAGEALAAAVGGVLSSLTVTDAVCESPAPFVAVQVMVVPAVSAVSVITPQPDSESMPEIGSLKLQVTEVSELFQPAALGDGDTLDVMTGAVTSM